MTTANYTFLTEVTLQDGQLFPTSSAEGVYIINAIESDTGTIFTDEIVFLDTLIGDNTYSQQQLTYTGTAADFDGVLYPIYQDTNLGDSYLDLFILSNTAITGSSPVLNAPEYTLCLMSGALIRVVECEIPVEGLSIGDLVATPDGLRRVRFIGETRKPPIELRRQGRMPIRIEAGALGELGPQAPLHCTPSHAFLIKGCLVEAQALINGTTIRQLESWDEETVTYYSIELEEHALVWANGLLSETYFASVRGKHFSRTSWSNYADYQALYGEGEVMQELPHPRIPFARQLPAEIRELAGVPDPAEAEAALYALS